MAINPPSRRTKTTLLPSVLQDTGLAAVPGDAALILPLLPASATSAKAKLKNIKRGSGVSEEQVSGDLWPIPLRWRPAHEGTMRERGRRCCTAHISFCPLSQSQSPGGRPLVLPCSPPNSCPPSPGISVPAWTPSPTPLQMRSFVLRRLALTPLLDTPHTGRMPGKKTPHRSGRARVGVDCFPSYI